MSTHTSNVRPKPDKVLTDIADYVAGYEIKSSEAYDTARLCLMDTLGCGLEALEYLACTRVDWITSLTAGCAAGRAVLL